MVGLVDAKSLAPQGHLSQKVDKAVDLKRLYEIVEPLYSEEERRPSVDPVVLTMYENGQHRPSGAARRMEG